MSSALVAAILCGLAVIIAARPHDESKAQWTGKPWLGKWESTDKTPENWEAFVKAANIEPKYQSLYSGKQKAIITIYKEGDSHYHAQMTFPGTDHKKEWDFKIGQEGTYSMDGTEVKYVYTENGDQLDSKLNIPSKNTEMTHTYKVTGDELEHIFTSNGATGKKWYKKVNNAV
ncbi:SAHS6 [Ramazzottius varieornatus]|uniref:SAHS6 n=1 Tax=Ramazzottius varieornatus TaxID=947166 RepID=A0A1D1UJP0_RAMVA|nr:SAHS6 [Ramazzottius varieornatus]